MGGFDGGLDSRRECRPRPECRHRRPRSPESGRLVAVERGEALDDLRAAAMAVHVAEAADVHEDVEAEGGSGMEGAERFVMLAAMAEAELDDLGDCGRLEARRRGRGSGGRGGGWRSRAAWRPARLRGSRCARPGPPRALGDRHVAEQLGGGLREFGLGLDRVVVGLGVFDQGGRGADLAGEELAASAARAGSAAASLSTKAAAAWALTFQAGPVAASRSFTAQVADLGDGVGEQAGDLGFEGAGADDLAERGVGGQRKQVAGHVEGAGLEGALVGFGLEGFRTGDAAAEEFEDGRGGALVGGKEILDGLGVELGRGGILAKIREIPAGLEEVLVAGRALLAVPALLVDEDDGGQQAEALDGEGDVGQVGNGAVAVLESRRCSGTARHAGR